MEWRPVVGFEHVYEVSDTGLVRRTGKSRGTHPGRLLANTRHAQGYFVNSLWQNNHATLILTHRIVAAAFLGPAPASSDVNHKDGNKRHNHIANLEYCTRQENIHHAIAHGLIRVSGEDNPMARLTITQVREMRSLHETGWGYKRLGVRFGVPWGTARNVITRKTWGHLDEQGSAGVALEEPDCSLFRRIAGDTTAIPAELQTPWEGTDSGA